MEVIARSRYLHHSPRKIQLVASLLPGLTASKGLEVLTQMSQKAAKDLALILQQGIGNAAHNFNLDKKTLLIKTVEVGRGPLIKRFRPVSRGRAHSIHRPTAHVKLVLEAATPPPKKEENNGTKS